MDSVSIKSSVCFIGFLRCETNGKKQIRENRKKDDFGEKERQVRRERGRNFFFFTKRISDLVFWIDEKFIMQQDIDQSVKIQSGRKVRVKSCCKVD